MKSGEQFILLSFVFLPFSQNQHFPNIYIPLEYVVYFQTAYSTERSIPNFFKNDSSLWVPQKIREKECSETCMEVKFLLGGKVMPGITKLEEEFGLLYLTWW